jgi:hypothetical protein
VSRFADTIRVQALRGEAEDFIAALEVHYPRIKLPDGARHDLVDRLVRTALILSCTDHVFFRFSSLI